MSKLIQPLDVLLAHDEWATLKIIGACRGLSEEQFHQRFDMGFASLHDTIAHMIAATRLWIDVVEKRELRPRVDQDGARRSLDDLTTLHGETMRELNQSIRAHSLADQGTRHRQDKVLTITHGALITHVCTHAMHHRAQCLNMLKQLGVKPLPASSVVEWTAEVEGSVSPA